ncbi:MAG: NADH-quinone oxidoreductase subunit L [Deltaproteobacteria bacterium]|nr:MAG: NADH-quinone oxidoreductase subunit L [Deltaproteobacteria bacterium]
MTPHSVLLFGAASTPLVYALAALFPSSHRPLRGPSVAATWSFFATLALAGAVALGGSVLAPPLRVDGLTVAMMALVHLVALVITRFSTSYLDGDPHLVRYSRWLSATLAAVSTLVIADHLLVIAVAWTASSLCLHQLLVHFDRPAAHVAAHMKFVVSRTADALFLGALWLVWQELHTLSLAGAAVALGDADPGPLLQLAAVLVAGCVILKSAQLPFHGWLARVMEAPTPVSALLHAGIVNIGGFVLLRMAFLFAEAPAAQTLLVAVGTTTAVVAGLVMTTQTTIKAMLAWSTMAQMGFMLMQCGLGAWPLALLHLLGHSLYKAHAFLSSGSTVDQARALGLAKESGGATVGSWLGAAGLAVLGVTAVGWAFGANPVEEPALWSLSTVLSLALAPLLLGGRRVFGLSALAGLSVATLYFGWHAVFAAMLPPGHTDAVRVGIVIVGFASGFALQAWMHGAPESALTRALYPRLAAGLYLDPLVTRLTRQLWPSPRRPSATEN